MTLILEAPAPSLCADRALPARLRARFAQDFLSDPSAYKPDSFYSQRLNHAMAFALKAHQNQKRKGRHTPYMAHLLTVAANLLSFAPIQPGEQYLEKDVLLRSTGARVDITLEDAFIAALLHDAMEDQGGADMKARIQERFGPVVAELVDYCTTPPHPENAPGRKSAGYNDHKRAQLLRVTREAPQTATLIAACDKLANLRDTVQEYAEDGAAFWKRFSVSPAEKMRYNQDIAEIFLQSGRYPQIAREIAQTVRRLRIMIRRTENPIVRFWHHRIVLPMRALLTRLRLEWSPLPPPTPQPRGVLA